jgi:hypothetical protein
VSANIRDRVVVFRLSQDEYRSLRETCESRGARNLSDFTRSEVLAFLNPATRQDRLNLRFAALEEEIAALKTAVAHLKHLLKGADHVEPAAQA